MLVPMINNAPRTTPTPQIYDILCPDMKKTQKIGKIMSDILFPGLTNSDIGAIIFPYTLEETHGRKNRGKPVGQFRPDSRTYQYHNSPRPLRRRQIRLRDHFRNRTQKPRSVRNEATLSLQRVETSGKGRIHYVLLGRFGQRRTAEILLAHRRGQRRFRNESGGMGIFPYGDRQSDFG